MKSSVTGEFRKLRLAAVKGDTDWGKLRQESRKLLGSRM